MFKSRITPFIFSFVIGLWLTSLITSWADEIEFSVDPADRTEHQGPAKSRSSVCVEDKNYYRIKELELEIEIQELKLQVMRSEQNQKAGQKLTLQELSNHMILSEQLKSLEMKQHFENPIYREVCY